MLILLSCAKIMANRSNVVVPTTTKPLFTNEAAEIAMHLSQYSVEELERILRVNAKIAVENYHRYQAFHAADTPKLSALLAYSGIVFKRIHSADFTEEDFKYAQGHLRLTSFCYGLLRPLDLIRPYRLEGDVQLPELGAETLFDYWKPRLTDLFIDEIKSKGGVLCYLASDEMRSLFDWKCIEKNVNVITPEFKVWKNGKWSTVVVYTKMARGEMTRYLLKRRLTTIESIKQFTWEGFEFSEALSDEKRFVFVNGATI